MAMPQSCLGPTRFIDSEHPEVVRFTKESVGDATSTKERAIRLFYAVRDSIRYDPYTFSLDPDIYMASTTLARRAGFCVPKSVLLAAAARAAGIPARLHIADVQNHLMPEGFHERLGKDTIYGHGFNELFVDGRWLKMTTAFNREMCEMLGVPTLEFDGENDALFQPFDARGRKNLDYVRDRGVHDDLPFEELERIYRKYHGDFLASL
jgi:transglutaminase-like putative cysteine protease